MTRKIVHCFLGSQDLRCQAQIAMGSIKRHSRKTSHDDLNDVRSCFREFVGQSAKSLSRDDSQCRVNGRASNGAVVDLCLNA